MSIVIEKTKQKTSKRSITSPVTTFSTIEALHVCLQKSDTIKKELSAHYKLFFNLFIIAYFI